MKDPEKRGRKLFSAFFLVIVLGFSAVNAVLRTGDVWGDVKEIRWTPTNAGQALRDVERSAKENLYLRRPMLEAYGAVQLTAGKHETNNFEVVRDKNGFLYKSNSWDDFRDDTRELVFRTKYLQRKVESRGSRFGFVMLPMNHPQEDARYCGLPYSDFSHQSATFCAWADYYGVPVLDLQEQWKKAGLTQEEAFFKTDTAWTPLAAVHGYGEVLRWIQDAFDGEIPQLSSLCRLDNYYRTTYENAVNGSLGRKVGLTFGGGPEDYTVIWPKDEGMYRLEIDDQVYEGTFREALLKLDRNETSYGDTQQIYLRDPTAAWISVENRRPILKQKILLLGDPCAAPVGAFLAQSFARVDMLKLGSRTREELNEVLARERYDYVIQMLCPEELTFLFFDFGPDAGPGT